jgi:hypothetical protein
MILHGCDGLHLVGFERFVHGVTWTPDFLEAGVLIILTALLII